MQGFGLQMWEEGCAPHGVKQYYGTLSGFQPFISEGLEQPEAAFEPRSSRIEDYASSPIGKRGENPCRHHAVPNAGQSQPTGDHVCKGALTSAQVTAALECESDPSHSVCSHYSGTSL